MKTNGRQDEPQIDNFGGGTYLYSFEQADHVLKRILATICEEEKAENLSLPPTNECFHNVGKKELIKFSALTEPRTKNVSLFKSGSDLKLSRTEFSFTKK